MNTANPPFDLPALSLPSLRPSMSRSDRAVDPVPSVDSAALLQGRSVVHIEHNGALYQLRSTRLGKLILTK